VFLIEGAELLRRWMWVFFRVEWEVIRQEDANEANDREGHILWPTTSAGNGDVASDVTELSQMAPGS